MTSTFDLLAVILVGLVGLVAIAVVVVLVARRGKSAESSLDSAVDGVIATTLAPHLDGAAESEVLTAIQAPQQHEDLAARVRAMVLKAELVIKRVDGDWQACVEVWRVGEDPEKISKTTTKFAVHWDELPDHIRERLMRDRESVVIPWQVAVEQDAVH